MTRFQANELLSLADDIVKPEQEVGWWFDSFEEVRDCRTHQCALGRMPARRPQSWKWDRDGRTLCPVLVGSNWTVGSMASASRYFGIHVDLVEVLFYPHVSFPHRCEGMCSLPSDATAEQVAANIRKAVRLLEEKGMINED